MPIFEAEVRGKTCSEDMLTSRVFGTLAILDKQKVLNPLLGELGLSLPEEEVRQAQIRFWQYHKGTYPDISINTPNSLIFIEVKEAALVESSQLEQQYKAGATEANKKRVNFSYVLLTNDKQKPPDVAKAEKSLSARFPNVNISWNQWRNIWLFLNRIKEELAKNDASRYLVEDLISLLEVKGMKYPSGLEPEWFMKVSDAIPSLLKLCREIKVIIEKLNEEAEKYELEPMEPMPFGATKPKFQSPNEWVWLKWDFPYKDRNWKRIDKPSQDEKELYLYVGFYINEAKVEVGFFTDHASDKQIDEVKAKVKKGKGIQYNTFEEEGWLALSYDLPLEELRDGKRVVETLVDRLAKARDFVNTLKAFHGELGLTSLKRVKTTK